MSKIGDAMIEIEEMYNAGMTSNQIYDITGYPMSWITDVIERIEGPDDSDYYDDSMDGDEASGLASAGWGTEDYGGGIDDVF